MRHSLRPDIRAYHTFREELATMFSPGVSVPDNNGGGGFPSDGSLGHGAGGNMMIPASTYGDIAAGF